MRVHDLIGKLVSDTYIGTILRLAYNSFYRIISIKILFVNNSRYQNIQKFYAYICDENKT